MNYRHAFHAGNFADVLKHCILCLAIERLNAKPAPYFVLDTHAGRGIYNLAGEEAARTQEWRKGVERLWNEPPEGSAGTPLRPWFEALREFNPEGVLRRYPGSPALIAHMKRDSDRAVFYERHPDDAAALNRHFAHKPRITVHMSDGWPSVAKYLPPIERRGLVLIDPPFEDRRDYVRLSEALHQGYRRFSTGTYLLWYPIKGLADRNGLINAMKTLNLPRVAQVELHLRTPNHPGRFDGAGLVIVNPPYLLIDQLNVVLPLFVERFATASGACHIIDWLSGLPA